jgi:L-glyceraldehyde 3-phosphate reductase
LTNKYLDGIPSGSRAAKSHGALKIAQITPEVLRRISALNQLAAGRGQSLAQMAIAWLLRDKRVTSVLVGASSESQLEDSLDALKNKSFSPDELGRIEQILK